MDTKYLWKFCSLGGVSRVRISSGEDIAHLGELDQKLWTTLSCPVEGLEFNREFLSLMDSDKDGKIRVHEVVQASEWICSVLKDKDILLDGGSDISLSNIDSNSPTGSRLAASAAQILRNLGKESDKISLADSADSVAIFSGTRFNGDGIVCELSADDPAQKKAIAACLATLGGKTDRSGAQGIDKALLDDFYAQLQAYSSWRKSVNPELLPYGANTDKALCACEKLSAKINDFFVRCSLIAFNADAAAQLDTSLSAISAAAGQDLSQCNEAIAASPLARPNKEGVLPFSGINPAWQADWDALKSLVLDVELPDAEQLKREEWQKILAKFDSYRAWKNAKAGAGVESLGLESIDELLAENAKAGIEGLIGQDLALCDEANSIDDVHKLLLLRRYLYEFLDNYVIFGAFYDKARKSVFEAGKLYIDQRCLDLCIRVSDMGKHSDMASQSGMYIIYCNCTSKKTGKSLTIAAILTDGDVDNLRVGMNAVFYDRDGLDYDAVVTKIVDNPISVRQAFWLPYKKVARTITERINKSAAEKESKISSQLTSAAAKAELPKADAAAPAAAKQPFDIAKFAGIFAALGMGVGMIASALAALVKPWYMPLIVLFVLVVIISGPSMFIAWNKLRKRNLGPILNANGWAINSVVLVNALFGSTLTSLARYPKVLRAGDPYAPKKKSPWPWIVSIIIILAIVFLALWLTGNMAWAGLPKPL
ncbi:MAG: hypothetical protein ACI3ZK_01195 [Candidatus Cryptobacteroides sp.]